MSLSLGTGLALAGALRLADGVGVVDRVGGREGMGVDELDLTGGLVIL